MQSSDGITKSPLNKDFFFLRLRAFKCSDLFLSRLIMLANIVQCSLSLIDFLMFHFRLLMLNINKLLKQDKHSIIVSHTHERIFINATCIIALSFQSMYTRPVIFVTYPSEISTHIQFLSYTLNLLTVRLFRYT